MSRFITNEAEPPEICRDCQLLRRSFPGACSLSRWTCWGNYTPKECEEMDEGERELRNDIDEAMMVDHPDPEREAERADYLMDVVRDREMTRGKE